MYSFLTQHPHQQRTLRTGFLAATYQAQGFLLGTLQERKDRQAGHSVHWINQIGDSHTQWQFYTLGK